MKRSRRDFLKQTAAAAGGGAVLFDIVPARVLGLQGQPPPSDIINFGHIGIGGRGKMLLRPETDLGKEVPPSPFLGGDGSRRSRGPARSIALCDVDAQHLDAAATQVGGKPHLYKDFRRLLEDKEVDAVVIATPDHWHALMMIMACQAGKDVYVEKPASKTIEEGRAMVTAAERYARVVQVGSQGRSQLGAWQGGNYIHGGQIGTVHKVTCWHPGGRAGDWTPDSAAPSALDYDTWIGPARWIPYNVRRVHGAFRSMMDFGGGAICDRGAHIMSIASWIMQVDRTGPVSVEAIGEPPHDGMYDTPVTMEVTYEFKKPDWTLVWGQPGTASSEMKVDYGATYWSDNGRLTISYGDGSHTVTEPKAKEYAAQNDTHWAYRSPGHSENFEDCIRTRQQPVMHIEAGHRVATLCVLGNIAFLLRRKLEWDPMNERFRDDDEANRLLSRPGRGTWNL